MSQKIINFSYEYVVWRVWVLLLGGLFKFLSSSCAIVRISRSGTKWKLRSQVQMLLTFIFLNFAYRLATIYIIVVIILGIILKLIQINRYLLSKFKKAQNVHVQCISISFSFNKDNKTIVRHTMLLITGFFF